MSRFDDPVVIGLPKDPPPDGIWLGDGAYHKLFKPTPQPADQPPPEQKQVEICRSFSYKLNLANHGGPQYESADFFCSRKLACKEDDAPAVSESLFEDCVTEIQTAVKGFVRNMQQKRADQVERATAQRAAESQSQVRAHPTREVARRPARGE
jgi:hypothetical protein